MISVDRLASVPGVVGVDPCHVMIETEGIGLTGYTADDWLRDQREIDLELADHRRLMALVSFAHGDNEIDRLVAGLRDLVNAHADRDPGTGIDSWPSRPQLRTEQAMLPRDAFFARAEDIPVEKVVGRVSAELITPYPPGIPALAPGERITAPLIEYLQAFVAAGGFVEGAADQTLGTMRVVVP